MIAKSEIMQVVIIQVAIQAVTMVVRAMREADLTAEKHTRRSSPEEPQRSWQAVPR